MNYFPHFLNASAADLLDRTRLVGLAKRRQSRPSRLTVVCVVRSRVVLVQVWGLGLSVRVA